MELFFSVDIEIFYFLFFASLGIDNFETVLWNDLQFFFFYFTFGSLKDYFVIALAFFNFEALVLVSFSKSFFYAVFISTENDLELALTSLFLLIF